MIDQIIYLESWNTWWAYLSHMLKDLLLHLSVQSTKQWWGVLYFFHLFCGKRWTENWKVRLKVKSHATTLVRPSVTPHSLLYKITWNLSEGLVFPESIQRKYNKRQIEWRWRNSGCLSSCVAWSLFIYHLTWSASVISSESL